MIPGQEFSLYPLGTRYRLVKQVGLDPNCWIVETVGQNVPLQVWDISPIVWSSYYLHTICRPDPKELLGF